MMNRAPTGGSQFRRRKFTVVGYWCKVAKDLRFICLKGNPFGLASAVLNYNRAGEFLVLVMRCIFGSCCTHFYDDHLALEPSIAQGSAQVRYRGFCSLLSVHLDESKRRKMKPDFLFIGCRFVLISLFESFGLTLSPKEGRIERVTRQIEQYLQRAFNAG